MISDEMRELLSAYVDGELRGSDAQRVEELSKRSPELRREITSYRTLRGKLRDWDEAEHGVAPAPTLRARAVARAHTLNADRAAARRGRLLTIAFGPVTQAAGVLVAAATGIALALAGGDGEAPARVAARHVPIDPAAPAVVVEPRGSALEEHVARAPETPRRGLPDLLRWEGRLVDGVVLSDAAIRLREEWAAEDRYFERRKRLVVKDDGPRTRSLNREVHALVRGYEAYAEPVEGVVVLRHPEIARAVLPKLEGAGPGDLSLVDQPGSAARLMVERASVGGPVLAPLGEVWVAAKDRTNRTRVVTASNVTLGQNDMVAVAWADGIAPTQHRGNLAVQPFILGPEARRRVLGAEGLDADLVAWLRAHHGGADLVTAFRKDEAAREREVARLLAALAADREATGFAVVDAAGRTLGVELFGTRDLMLSLAPRLLRGYVFEAGADIRLRKPREVAASERVQQVLDVLAERATARIAMTGKGTTDGLERYGLAQVLLQDAKGAALGHGIARGDQPVHLTVFP